MKKSVIYFGGFVAFIISLMIMALLLREKKGLVINQVLFQNFHGTEDFDNKLGMLRSRHAAFLDSLKNRAESIGEPQGWVKYFEKKDELTLIEKEQADQYTQQVWTRLNQYIKDYGREYEYDLILGAKGDGNLMYADDRLDITEEVLEYVNKKYDGE